MNRVAQGMVMILFGAAVLSVTVASRLYLNYVQAGFRPFLVAAGAALVILGAATVAGGLRADAKEAGRGSGGPGHDHDRAPGVAWLLLLPTAVVFVVAPPALGAYTAAEAGPAPAAQGLRELEEFGAGISEGQPVPMRMREFVLRAWTDSERSMAGREIQLTGFAVPDPEGRGWYLARLQVACCAADAVVNRVLVENEPAPPKDSWWTVRGRWVEPEGDLREVRDHRFAVEEMTSVDNPPEPYE